MRNQGLWLRGRSSRIVLGACLASLLVVSAGGSADAQEGQGKFITEASLRLSKLIDSANKAGYKLNDNVFSVGGGWLKQGQDNWVPLYNLTLEKGKQYRFIAVGDGDAKDVDIQIRDGTGNVVKDDTAAARDASVDFSPNDTGKFEVRVRVFASDNDVPCLCLAIVMAK